MHAAFEKFAFERLRDRRFSRAGQARQPNDRAAMSVVAARAACAVIFPSRPENVFALDRGAIGVSAAENDSAAADSSVIDDNEAPEIGDAIVIIQHERRARLNRDAADFIARDFSSRLGRGARASTNP